MGGPSYRALIHQLGRPGCVCIVAHSCAWRPLTARLTLSEFLDRPPLSGRAARLGDRRILKPNALGSTVALIFLPMSSDRIIVEAIKAGQNLLSQNLPPAHSLTDAATVMRFRELVRSQAIRSALERSSDTFLAFVLREIGHVVADQSKTNRQIISRLWGVFDDPHLNQALGIPDNRGKTVGPPKRF